MSNINETEPNIIEQPVLKKKTESETDRVKGGLSATAIKMIAVVTMLIDHIGAFVVSRLISLGYFRTNKVLFDFVGTSVTVEKLVYYTLRVIGKISFPLFCFFIVEGFFHTKSRAKYLLRLLIFAFISEIPFKVALEGFGGSIGHLLAPSNVLYTLLIGLIVIWSAQTLKKYAPGGFVAVCFRILVCLIPTAYVAYEVYSILCFNETLAAQPLLFAQVYLGLAAATLIATLIYGKLTTKENARIISSSLSFLGMGMIVADLLDTDYSSVGVLIIFVMYVMAGRKKIVGMALSNAILALNNFLEWPAFIDVLIISKYNGKRGKGLKYFFYIFYPAHLSLIVLILFLTGLI